MWRKTWTYPHKLNSSKDDSLTLTQCLSRYPDIAGLNNEKCYFTFLNDHSLLLTGTPFRCNGVSYNHNLDLNMSVWICKAQRSIRVFFKVFKSNVFPRCRNITVKGIYTIFLIVVLQTAFLLYQNCLHLSDNGYRHMKQRVVYVGQRICSSQQCAWGWAGYCLYSEGQLSVRKLYLRIGTWSTLLSTFVSLSRVWVITDVVLDWRLD